MEKIKELIEFITTNWTTILLILGGAITSAVTIASIIVKATPTLKDDNALLPIVKFIGKYVALNKNVDTENRPQ